MLKPVLSDDEGLKNVIDITIVKVESRIEQLKAQNDAGLQDPDIDIDETIALISQLQILTESHDLLTQSKKDLIAGKEINVAEIEKAFEAIQGLIEVEG